MATVERPPIETIVLRNVSWETYERLLADYADSSSPRLTYDQGTLEIKSPFQEHEEYNCTIALLLEVIAEEWNLDVRSLGSTTFKREDLARGFEPDSCFYIQNAERVEGKTRLDLNVDPPPDLVIEIEITSPALPKLPIYAQLGTPEVWRYDGGALVILALESGAYVERDESLALPGLDSATLSAFMEDSKSLKRTQWLRKVRDWARGLGNSAQL